jgi:hypothetical protein
MKRLLVLFATVFTALTLSAQIKAVEEFVENHPELDKYYVYQSQLRILNQEGNEDFNRLIKDVKKIKAYVQEGDANVSRESYNSMVEQLENDGFEVYIKATMEGVLVNLLGREVGKDSYFVLAVNDPSNFALVELDGKLDLSYLKALDDIDFNKLQSILLSSDHEQTDSINID